MHEVMMSIIPSSVGSDEKCNHLPILALRTNSILLVSMCFRSPTHCLPRSWVRSGSRRAGGRCGLLPPIGATKRNFYLPLAAVYKQWHIKLIGEGKWPAVFHCTWTEEREYCLSASRGGFATVQLRPRSIRCFPGVRLSGAFSGLASPFRH
ncbi:hypothetical protein P168DRAFT_152620 [Aspergillus campestris IBT 28561]|uniref:Uncharacterized protein n=1 Tax=Aspergillus campestris (strain IBT 28561) TaxID=1392248 RepID=A0A2I1D2N5_ASPC2|nr:uncharacterized protein P168DRAFT_152620 [Aspergillus campestris IBT 28561]PKY04134.1 hypothetical protein P168DRAFT_152620 [Aspergillus campestris IBT 28561]